MCFHAQAVGNIPYLTCRAVRYCPQFLIVVKGNRIEHNVVMDMTFINVSRHHILILAVCVFKCQFLPQLMGLLRRHSVLRRKGLYQVIGKICRTLPFQVPRFVRKHGCHFKINGSRLRFAVIAGYQHLAIGFVWIFYIGQSFTKGGFNRMDFCDSHRIS